MPRRHLLSVVATLFIAATALCQSLTVEDLLAVFPLSAKAKTVFRTEVRAEQLSQDQANALIWKLMAEGETLLSKKETEEMAAFYWKAVETLTPEEQMFVAKVTLKVEQGQGFSATDQRKSSALVQKGFSKLSAKDDARYLRLRAKAIELALLKPQQAEQKFKSAYPPVQTSVESMTAEQKLKRLQAITEKALSFLSEKDRTRFLELQLTPADQLTQAQYTERLEFAVKITSLLSDAENREMKEIAADMLKEK
jgi:hypothetical protein